MAVTMDDMPGSPWYAVDPAPDDSFTIGDIVNLTVGGPDMVVISTCECGSIEVAWVKVDGDVMVDAFPAEVLVGDYIPCARKI